MVGRLTVLMALIGWDLRWHSKVAVWDHKLLGKFRFTFKLSKLSTGHPKITQKSCYRNGIGSTALHIAAANDEEEICKMILEDPRSFFFFFFREFGDTKRCWEFDRIFDIIFRVQGGIPSKRWHMVPAIIFLGPSQASITRQVDPTFPTPQVYIRRQRGEWQRPDATGPLQMLRKNCDVQIQCILTARVGSLARTLLLNLGMGLWKSWRFPWFFGALLERMMAHSLGNLTGRFMFFFEVQTRACSGSAMIEGKNEILRTSRHSIYFKFHKVNERIVKARKAIWRYSAESCSFSQPLWSCKKQASSMINDSIWSKKHWTSHSLQSYAFTSTTHNFNEFSYSSLCAFLRALAAMELPFRWWSPAMDLCDAFGAHCSNNSLLSCIWKELAGLSRGRGFVKQVEVGGFHINSVKMMMREWRDDLDLLNRLCLFFGSTKILIITFI